MAQSSGEKRRGKVPGEKGQCPVLAGGLVSAQCAVLCNSRPRGVLPPENLFKVEMIEAPYRTPTPIREDGAERFITTRYQPKTIFATAPSKEVDAAWDGWLIRPRVPIPKDKTRALGLPESVEHLEDVGSGGIYVRGVYHQMHCLSRLRKSLYRERHYPNEDDESVEHHFLHCLNVLRQAILCHGNISLAYWWNSNFSYIDNNGETQYSPESVAMTPKERDLAAFMGWDSPVQCRDMMVLMPGWTTMRLMQTNMVGRG
ncbi:hypothetical protein BDW74DRAFT_173219 [Aspergillus multicolor]|uniref:oxidase ustYa family protein n=1 Tax=Aspergillus multicolor TaxID=41759 RepID=UPI003CCCB99D